jgi:hypothetical protein
MAEQLVRFTLDAAQRTKACVRAFEAGELGGEPVSRASRSRHDRPPIRAILLEDLVDEGEADAAVTYKASMTEIQKLTVLGFVSSGTFSLSFKGASTDSLPFNVLPTALQTALENLPTIGKNNVRVTLGSFAPDPKQPTQLDYVGVWLIEFRGTFLTRDPATIPLLVPASSLGSTGPSLLIAEHTQWADTGMIETIHAILPLTTPTPVRAGAVVTAKQWPGLGYGLETVQPRQFGNPY